MTKTKKCLEFGKLGFVCDLGFGDWNLERLDSQLAVHKMKCVEGQINTKDHK